MDRPEQFWQPLHLQYQAGDLDFEQSFNILDDETGYYIGECGMGVNMKNGVLQNNPENVIALDVWLFDKKTDKTLSSQTRVLLSEYAIDNKLEQAFTRERQNESPPVVAQPGVAFQLKGQNLVVDCQIIEAKYTGSATTSGIFQKREGRNDCPCQRMIRSGAFFRIIQTSMFLYCVAISHTGDIVAHNLSNSPGLFFAPCRVSWGSCSGCSI